MGDFDKSSRAVIRGEPQAFFLWLAPRFVERFTFARWADTRAVAFPGEPDRTCDTVAEFVPLDGEGPRRLLDVEVQAEPDSEMLDRSGDYAFRLRRTLRYGENHQQKYHVISVVVNLTGPEQPFELDMRQPELDGAGIHERLFQVTMREKDAVETLAAIAVDPRLRGVLPLVPLMRRGDEPDIIEDWKRLAELVPDDRKRAAHGTLALVFADLADRWPLWKRGLEGWNVRRSQQVLEWQAEREHAKTLRLYELRFHAPFPEDLENELRKLVDPGELSQWFDAVATADSPDAFRAAISQPHPSETNGAT